MTYPDLGGMSEDELRAYLATLDAQDAADRVRLEHPDALRNAAIWYASVGIAVFPCVPRAKRPITKAGLYDATTDPAVIASWWTRQPQANIGIPTGHTFDVIDVDGPAGLMSWLTMEDAGLPFRVIGRVLTPNGRHILIPPTGDGNAARIRPGIDYRGRGGYVIAAPSIGEDGRRYTWLDPIEIGANT